MDWRKYIHSDAEVLLGKPVVKGTRLSVEFLLGLFAVGWTEKQVLENYPTLTPQSLQAVFALTGIIRSVVTRFLVATHATRAFRGTGGEAFPLTT